MLENSQGLPKAKQSVERTVNKKIYTGKPGHATVDSLIKQAIADAPQPKDVDELVGFIVITFQSQACTTPPSGEMGCMHTAIITQLQRSRLHPVIMPAVPISGKLQDIGSSLGLGRWPSGMDYFAWELLCTMRHLTDALNDVYPIG